MKKEWEGRIEKLLLIKKTKLKNKNKNNVDFLYNERIINKVYKNQSKFLKKQ
jgi:hypothetical protein